MRRKAVSIFIVLLFTLALVKNSVYAQTGSDNKSVNISLESVNVDPGKVVEIPIKVTDNPGISGVMITISFDESLTLMEVIPGEDFSSMTFTGPGDISEETINLLWDSETDITNNGTIATLEIQVPEVAGTYMVSMEVEEGNITDSNLSPIHVNVIDGNITVNEKRHILSSGNCGDTCRYLLYDDGVLEILGSGSMFDFSSEGEVPWNEYREYITEVRLENSINDIGEYAFWNCSSLKNVEVSEELSEIGAYAFYGCINLTNIVIPDSVQTIGENAFFGCTNLADVFFQGEKTAWDQLSEDSGIGPVNIFADGSEDESMIVEIITVEVPGGIAVTMKSEGNSIYYTLNGTSVCTKSIPYEETFFIDKAGTYFIRALAVNADKGICGSETSDVVEISKSAMPVITEDDGQITILPEQCVYYTLNLEEEPTKDSYMYSKPIDYLTRTTLIQARVIEPGKEKSEVAAYQFEVEEKKTFQYPEDSFSFANFAPDYVGNNDKEDLFISVFGKNKGREFAAVFEMNGYCFGMSAVSLLFSTGLLQPYKFSDEEDFARATMAYQLKSPNNNPQLKRLIERYQIVQAMESVEKEQWETEVPNGSKEKYEELLSTIRKACRGEQRIILILFSPQNRFSHAVVPYKMEEGKIYVYDCKYPGAENIITYSINDAGSFSYYYKDNLTGGIGYNDFDNIVKIMNGLEMGIVEPFAGEKTETIISLNSSAYKVFDENGQESEKFVLCRTADMQSDKDIFYLDDAKYSLRNLDEGLTQFEVTASTDEESCTVIVSDPTAEIQVGKENGRLCLTVNCNSDSTIQAHTLNVDERENNIKVVADYLKVYSCTEAATLINTTAETAEINGGNELLYQKEETAELFYGAAAQNINNTVREAYIDIFGYDLKTDIRELTGEDCVVTAYAVNLNEGMTLIAAGYDENGKMIFSRKIPAEEGKTQYPFTIPGSVRSVKVFLADADSMKPLSDYIEIRQ